jgi:hypothetical protein
MLTILKVFALADEVRRLEREVEKFKRDRRPSWPATGSTVAGIRTSLPLSKISCSLQAFSVFE